MKILTIYDGTLQSKTALHYGIKKIKEKKGELVVLHVFPSNLFVGYDAVPMAEDIARQEWSQYAREAEAIIREYGQGVSVRLVPEEGDPEDNIRRYAAAEHPDLILATPRYKAIMKTLDRRVYIIPGTILVPVDNSDTVASGADTVIAEAKDAGAKVLLMGIVPLHLYSAEETAELEEVQKTTKATIKKMKKSLSAEAIEVSDIIRSGYPDEEILKAAKEFSVSLIMLPSGGKTPSELTKAAAVLLDEPERVQQPVCLIPEDGRSC